MSRQAMTTLILMMLILMACNLTTPTPAIGETPDQPQATDTPVSNLLTFTESTAGFSFNYPAALQYEERISAIPDRTIPYMLTFADFDFTDERYRSDELEYPVDAQIIEFSTRELPEGVSNMDDMRELSHQSFESGMFSGTTLNGEERRAIGSGLEANMYFMTLRDGSDTIMAETIINGYAIYFRAFGGSEAIDIILNSLVIE